MRTLRATLLPLLLLLPSCSDTAGDGSPPDAPDIDCPTSGRYFPLSTGSSWSFQVVDVRNGDVESKTQTVGPLEAMEGDKAGIQAFRMTTTKAAGTVVSWQEDTGDALLRHREIDMAGSNQSDEIYEPYKLRIDESDAHTVAGATWTTSHTEQVTDTIAGGTTTIEKTETWEVIAVDEVVVVPAGAFCGLRVRKVSSTGTSSSDKTYWFARGVGKVREAGTKQIEELTSYTLE